MTILSALYKKQSSILDEEEKKQLEIVRTGALKKKEVEGSWIDGMKNGLQEWREDAGNQFAMTRDIAINAMDGMGNALWNFASKGKGDFKSFAVSVINDIGQMITKMLVMNAVKAGSTAEWGSGVGLDLLMGSIPVMAVSMMLPASCIKGNGSVPQGVVAVKPGMLNFLNQLTYGCGYADGGLVGGSVARPSSNEDAGSDDRNIRVTVNIPLQVIKQGAAATQQSKDQGKTSDEALSLEARSRLRQVCYSVLDLELSNNGMILNAIKGA